MSKSLEVYHNFQQCFQHFWYATSDNIKQLKSLVPPCMCLKRVIRRCWLYCEVSGVSTLPHLVLFSFDIFLIFQDETQN